eukprot:930984_1
MEDILCDNEHEFQMILGIIEAGITDDEARPLKRDKEGSESPCLKSLRQLCIREYAERINTAALHGKRPIEFRVCIESLFTTRLTPFVPYLKAYGYEKMNHVLCDNENEFEEIVKIIEKGIEAQNKEIEQYDKHNSKSPKQPIKPVRIKQDMGGPLYSKLRRFCMRELAEEKTGWITRQGDDPDTEVDIDEYFKGNLAPFAKYLNDEGYEDMEDILCDDEDEFDQILEIIEYGIVRDNGPSLKRGNPQREYACLRSLRKLCMRGRDGRMKNMEVFSFQNGCSLITEKQKPIESTIRIESLFKDALAPFVPYLKQYRYETMEQVLCDDKKQFYTIVDIIEEGIEAENEEIEQYNDKHKPETPKQSIEPIRRAGGPVFGRLQRLCMRCLAEGKRGWITRADDSCTEVDIDDYFTGNLAPFAKYLKNEGYEDMGDILCDNKDEFDEILDIIETGIEADGRKPIKRNIERREYASFTSLRKLCLRAFAESRIQMLYNKGPTQLDIHSQFKDELAPFVTYLKAYGYERMEHVLCDGEKEFSVIVEIIEKGIEAENKEIEPPKQPIKPIRIKQAVGGPVFKRLQKLCMRDLAEGKWGWITRADDSDTEVDIDDYFTGNLAPFAKYLKDEGYEDMEDILCDDDDEFDDILDIIECGIAQNHGPPLKRGFLRSESPCLISLRKLCMRQHAEASSGWIQMLYDKGPTQLDIHSQFKDELAPFVTYLKAYGYERMEHVLCDDEKQFSVIVEIIEKGIEAENKEIEPPKQPIKPIRIKSKRGCPRFVKLQRLCLRDLAEGKWGWITRADDLDTEVDIERYFKGQLAPFAKYLKDECYETMEDILCDNEHEFQMILGIIEAGITDDEARPLKRDKEGSESPCLKSLRQLCIREYAERINTAALHGKRPIEFRVCIESLFTTRLTPFVPYLKAYGY